MKFILAISRRTKLTVPYISKETKPIALSTCKFIDAKHIDTYVDIHLVIV